jgi:hypothetical protein
MLQSIAYFTTPLKSLYKSGEFGIMLARNQVFTAASSGFLF